MTKAVVRVAALLAFTICVSMFLFSFTAKAVESEEPITVYTTEGTLVGYYDSLDDFMKSINERLIMPLAYACDTQGHTHGSSLVENAVRVSPTCELVTVTCRWCGGFIDQYYAYFGFRK